MAFLTRTANILAKKYDAATCLLLGKYARQAAKFTIPLRFSVLHESEADRPSCTDNDDTSCFSGSTGAFFAALEKGGSLSGLLPGNIGWDMVVLSNPVRTFKQYYHDFIHTLPYTHQNSIWLIDSSVDDDVFKLVFAIHDFHPNFSYITLVGRTATLTLVWRCSSTRHVTPIGDLTEIGALTRKDMLHHANIMFPVTNFQKYDFTGKHDILGALLTPERYAPDHFCRILENWLESVR